MNLIENMLGKQEQLAADFVKIHEAPENDKKKKEFDDVRNDEEVIEDDDVVAGTEEDVDAFDPGADAAVDTEEGTAVEESPFPDGKEYFGQKEDTYFYIVGSKTDEGTRDDLQMLDQNEKMLFSAKEHNVDLSDTANAIIEMISEIEIESISFDIFAKYFKPKLMEEEASIEEEDVDEDNFGNKDTDTESEDTFESKKVNEARLNVSFTNDDEMEFLRKVGYKYQVQLTGFTILDGDAAFDGNPATLDKVEDAILAKSSIYRGIDIIEESKLDEKTPPACGKCDKKHWAFNKCNDKEKTDDDTKKKSKPIKKKPLSDEEAQKQSDAIRYGGKENVDEETVGDKHQLRIAKDTLKMSDVGASVAGGPNKPEAREILKNKFGWSDERIAKLEESTMSVQLKYNNNVFDINMCENVVTINGRSFPLSSEIITFYNLKEARDLKCLGSDIIRAMGKDEIWMLSEGYGKKEEKKEDDCSDCGCDVCRCDDEQKKEAAEEDDTNEGCGKKHKEKTNEDSVNHVKAGTRFKRRISEDDLAKLDYEKLSKDGYLHGKVLQVNGNNIHVQYLNGSGDDLHIDDIIIDEKTNESIVQVKEISNKEETRKKLDNMTNLIKDVTATQALDILSNYDLTMAAHVIDKKFGKDTVYRLKNKNKTNEDVDKLSDDEIRNVGYSMLDQYTLGDDEIDKFRKDLKTKIEAGDEDAIAHVKECKEKAMKKPKVNEDLSATVKTLQKDALTAVKDGDYIKAADLVNRLSSVEGAVGVVSDAVVSEDELEIDADAEEEIVDKDYTDGSKEDFSDLDDEADDIEESKVDEKKVNEDGTEEKLAEEEVVAEEEKPAEEKPAEDEEVVVETPVETPTETPVETPAENPAEAAPVEGINPDYRKDNQATVVKKLSEEDEEIDTTNGVKVGDVEKTIMEGIFDGNRPEKPVEQLND